MAQGRFVAYYRVSTARQGASGLGLEAQQEAVRAYLNGGAWQIVGEVTEIESGKRNDRPKLAEAMRLCRLHGATLVIAKLDRLARNVAFVSNLMEGGVEFTAVDFPQANRLTVHILAAVAEHETRAISDRTKAALRAAKARGVKLGGHRGVVPTDAHRAMGAEVRKVKAQSLVVDLLPVIEEIRAEGLTTFGEIARALTARKIPTARGATTWTPMQVKRILDRVPV